jgi:hypothetical protein
MDAVKQAIDRGWTKDETVARVSLPSPYHLDEVAEKVAHQLLKVGVANLYERLSQ